MKYLSTLLERISKTLNRDELVKGRVVEVVRNYTKVTLNPTKINLKNGVLELETGPAAKNEIRLKEEIIKKELQLSRILYK